MSELKLRSNNVTHAKLVIDRGVEAVVLGSPFGQLYFGDTQHVFDDPRRGGGPSKGPIHEMSVAVRGGAVGYLQEVFNNHWNLAAPDDKLPVTPAIPSAPTSLKDGEFLASVQVVRTFDKMFAPATERRAGRARVVPARHPSSPSASSTSRTSTSTTTRSPRRWSTRSKRKPALQRDSAGQRRAGHAAVHGLAAEGDQTHPGLAR